MGNANRILVKSRGATTEFRLSSGNSSLPYTAEPLFKSVDRPASQRMSATESSWRLLTPGTDVGTHGWDACHGLIENPDGFAANGGIEFAEPDLGQQWLVGDVGPVGMRMAKTCEPADPQDLRTYPGGKDDYWMRDEAHSEFAKTDGQARSGPFARIAHLDTGYDPKHASKPLRLDAKLQRNFVDPGREKDASDDTDGILTNLGHGTGTLGILAGAMVENGRPLGCATDAEIVPIRVSDRVVLFYNSAIARGLDYVHDLTRDAATRVDVITMSMGGLASQAWADAVNALYEQGVFIVTAAGNNYANLPTRNIVYPARFNRVVAACGIMADGRPYADLGVGVMAGNYGPESAMATAMAAATPNTPWARIGCPRTIDHDGNGTSSATPQIAAAAALWIQRNSKEIERYPKAWMRVEAVRKALFSAAAHVDGETHRLGKGALKAFSALQVAPAHHNELTRQPPDTADFPFLDVLLGADFGITQGPRRQMLGLEALQLSQSKQVEDVLPDTSEPRGASRRKRSRA